MRSPLFESVYINRTRNEALAMGGKNGLFAGQVGGMLFVIQIDAFSSRYVQSFCGFRFFCVFVPGMQGGHAGDCRIAEAGDKKDVPQASIKESLGK